MIWESVKIIVALGLVLSAIVFIIRYGLTKILPFQSHQGGCLRIVERLPLSPKSGLVLVSAGEHYYLLGVSTDKINMLAQISSEEVENCVCKKEQPFSNIFDKYLFNNGEDAQGLHKMRDFVKKKLAGGRPWDDREE